MSPTLNIERSIPYLSRRHIWGVIRQRGIVYFSRNTYIFCPAREFYGTELEGGRCFSREGLTPIIKGTLTPITRVYSLVSIYDASRVFMFVFPAPQQAPRAPQHEAETE